MSTDRPSSARAAFEARNAVYLSHGYDRQDAARFVASVLDPPRDARVLDIGTGKGLLALALTARGNQVVSIDVDPTDRALVAELAHVSGADRRMALVTGDAASLPFSGGSFAAAASMDVLHHLDDPEPILREIVRTLAPQGELLLADFSAEGFDLIARIHHADGRTHPRSTVTLDRALEVLESWGFCTVVRLTRHFHDVAVCARHHHALGQDTLLSTRQAHHPHCLVCGRDSSHGLQLRFDVQPDRSVHAMFQGGGAFQGAPDTLHTGIVATLLDAAMTHCLFSRGLRARLTLMTVRHLASARWYRPCSVSGQLERMSRGVHHLTAVVRQGSRTIATAEGTFEPDLSAP